MAQVFPHHFGGLLLSIEIPNNITTYGDLLDLIARSWRGRDEIVVKAGAEGTIQDERGRAVGLWIISHD